MIENMKCQNCGASLARESYGIWVCEYCGSVYRVDENMHFVEIYHPDTAKLTAVVTYPMEIERYRDDKELKTYAIRELSYKFAQELPQFMKITTWDDPCELRKCVRGDIRIVNTKDALMRGILI